MTAPLRMDTTPVLSRLQKPNNPPGDWKTLPSKSISAYRCVHVQKLDEYDGGGNHNVYVDVIDENGNRIDKPGVALTFGWGGEHQSTFFEKPAPEPGANFMLSAGMDAWCHVDGGDIVEALMGENGHTSYYVVFQYQTAKPVTPPSDSDIGFVTISKRNLRGLLNRLMWSDGVTGESLQVIEDWLKK
jgi:hypothetical protein